MRDKVAKVQAMTESPATTAPLLLLSVIIPARNEEGCIGRTVEHLHVELRSYSIPHEIVVIDDNSTDRTWQVLTRLRAQVPTLKALRNPGAAGFGRATSYGLDHSSGDAV